MVLFRLGVACTVLGTQMMPRMVVATMMARVLTTVVPRTRSLVVAGVWAPMTMSLFGGVLLSLEEEFCSRCPAEELEHDPE